MAALPPPSFTSGELVWHRDGRSCLIHAVYTEDIEGRGEVAYEVRFSITGCQKVHESDLEKLRP